MSVDFDQESESNVIYNLRLEKIGNFFGTPIFLWIRSSLKKPLLQMFLKERGALSEARDKNIESRMKNIGEESQEPTPVCTARIGADIVYLVVCYGFYIPVLMLFFFPSRPLFWVGASITVFFILSHHYVLGVWGRITCPFSSYVCLCINKNPG